MTRAAEILERSAACFRESEAGDTRNAIERRGLMILSYALWETAIELEFRERSTAPFSKS